MSHYTNNLHRVFVDRTIGFKNKTSPTEADLKFFNEVKSIVKSHLKTNIKEFLEQQGITNTAPKFRIQGSWAYGTCNLPAKQGQEMDFDYGVYLPVRAFEGFNPDAGASEQAKTYFAQVEQMMRTLCYQQDWELDTSAPSSCIRIKISHNAHMDIPLYAVPDDMFDELEERNELQLSLDSAKAVNESLNFPIYDWALEDYGIRSFAEESLMDKNIQMIHMARRDGTWQESDCELIRKWFADKLKSLGNNGQQLRAICRYLKAWRDWQFADKSFQPSSILLMIITCKHYEYHQYRDDLALLSVLEKLSNDLRNNVSENIEGHQREDFNRMKEYERIQASQYADKLYQNFMASLNHSNKTKVLDFMTNEWGGRIPQDESLVETSRQSIFDTPPLVQSTITPQVPLRQG
ncbi:CBASS cGAMP synthase [Mannheimia haemolytica]|uniref:CBASS cGAMP synthase n=1 Tax=Mannheimia haemolytica TaxID=75985 RepID=UPI0039FBB876